MTLFDDEEPPAGAPPGARVRMTVAYLGTGFRGFASTPGVRTVGGELASALERILGHPVHLTCAGRTDAGVHAWGQVVHFDVVDQDADAARIARALNRLLAPEVVVRTSEVVDASFDARRSALARRYRYSVLNRGVPDPFLAATAWWVPQPLDLRSMQLGCDPIIGEHDFSSFCRRPSRDAAGPIVRRVHDARWLDLGDDVLRFDVEAAAFCHQMVRSLVGTLVAVGRGEKVAGDVAWILRARDRALAAPPAPPQGLCLWEVLYPPLQTAPAAADERREDAAAGRATGRLG